MFSLNLFNKKIAYHKFIGLISLVASLTTLVNAADKKRPYAESPPADLGSEDGKPVFNTTIRINPVKENWWVKTASVEDPIGKRLCSEDNSPRNRISRALLSEIFLTVPNLKGEVGLFNVQIVPTKNFPKIKDFPVCTYEANVSFRQGSKTYQVKNVFTLNVARMAVTDNAALANANAEKAAAEARAKAAAETKAKASAEKAASEAKEKAEAKAKADKARKDAEAAAAKAKKDAEAKAAAAEKSRKDAEQKAASAKAEGEKKAAEEAVAKAKLEKKAADEAVAKAKAEKASAEKAKKEAEAKALAAAKAQADAEAKATAEKKAKEAAEKKAKAAVDAKAAAAKAKKDEKDKPKVFQPEDRPVPEKPVISKESQIAFDEAATSSEPESEVESSSSSFTDGLFEYKSGNYTEAIKLLGKSKKPKSKKRGNAKRDEYVHANFYMGLALQKTGKLKEAVEAYKKVKKYEKYFPVLNMNLGTCYLELNQFAKAHHAYKDVIRDQSRIPPHRFDEVMQNTRYFWALSWTRLFESTTHPDKKRYYAANAHLKWKEYLSWYGDVPKYQDNKDRADHYMKTLPKK